MGDPFGDLCYSLYVNTTQDMRKKHLASLLHVYYDTFTEICERFSVAPVPGWSWEEFCRRFHRAQIYGIAMAVGALPVVLKNVDDVKDLEELGTAEDGVVDDDSMKELTSAIMGVNVENPMMMARIQGVVEDGIHAGVI